jgi:hypothetical protein
MKKTIANALMDNMTIANSSKAKLDAEKVGVDEFSSWKFAETVAYEALYRYASARNNTAHMGENASVDATLTSNAMKSIQMLLDCIGEVNGHAICKNQSMLDVLADCVIATKKPLAGEALKQDSIVKNFRSQLKEVNDGMSAEYVEKLTSDYESAKIKLAELKKLEDSCTTVCTRVTFNSFRAKLELAMGGIVAEQDAKTWEELEAEKEERRKARRAKTAEKKKAAKEAEKKAAAVA